MAAALPGPGGAGGTARELNRLLAGLPAEQRSAIVLRHLIGLPLAEVSRVMDCPESAVRTHLARGLLALRQPDQVPRADKLPCADQLPRADKAIRRGSHVQGCRP